MRGDYSNGRIYFIEPICDHEDNEVYYGSTLQILCKRMDKHRRDFKNWKDGNHGKYMCFEELEAREGYYIRNYDCNNKIIPGRTRKEYRIDNRDKSKEYYINNKIKIKEYYNDNKDKILEYHKEYRINNKDKIKTKQNVHYECPCGGRYNHSNKSQHFKTKKHIKYIEEQKPKK